MALDDPCPACTTSRAMRTNGAAVVRDCLAHCSECGATIWGGIDYVHTCRGGKLCGACYMQASDQAKRVGDLLARLFDEERTAFHGALESVCGDLLRAVDDHTEITLVHHEVFASLGAPHLPIRRTEVLVRNVPVVGVVSEIVTEGERRALRVYTEPLLFAVQG